MLPLARLLQSDTWNDALARMVFASISSPSTTDTHSTKTPDA